MDQGMDVVGELAQLTALDLSSLFNATGECPRRIGVVGRFAVWVSGGKMVRAETMGRSHSIAWRSRC